MTRSTPDTPRSDVLTVEAPTAADAVARVHDQLGPDARIVHASKVLRGGMWGFFPKEVVQLQAQPSGRVPANGTHPDPAPRGDVVTHEEVIVPKRSASDWSAREAAAQEPPMLSPDPAVAVPAVDPVPAAAPTAAGHLAGVLADLAAAEDHEEAGLGAALRRHLGVALEGEEPAPARTAATRSARPRVLHGDRIDPLPDMAPTGSPRVSPPPDGTSSAPSLAGLRPAGGGAGAMVSGSLSSATVGTEGSGPWSERALLHLGLSRGLVDTVLEQRPHDDASWVYALARALTPLCRPLPTGPSLLIGPRAGALAGRLSVPVVDGHDPAVGELDRCATSLADPSAWPSWLLETPRGRRWLHVVVGGRGWRSLLHAEPLAVSWSGEDNLGEALCTAHELGMVLGWGVHRSRTLITPSPIELSMVVRGLLGGAR